MVRARGLRLAGWVGNAVAPDMPWRAENIATLQQTLLAYGAPCLGLVPHLAKPTPVAVASCLDAAALHSLFAGTTKAAASTP